MHEADSDRLHGVARPGLVRIADHGVVPYVKSYYIINRMSNNLSNIPWRHINIITQLSQTEIPSK
ncbi:MAG: hypothetical protein RBR24_09680, partial [Candidatus Carbobacillus sp.]|nr:hypothetical protein [Candidatus Carbobacillus sp.]